LDSILTLSQAEADKIIFKPAPLNLSEVCQEVMREFQGDEEEEKRIIFINECLLNPVLADRSLIRYIIANLLVNAIKYSPKNTKIMFSLTCQPGKAILIIEDRGIGIPSEELDKLFDSFYRASNVRDIPGTGLGLSVVKQLVDLHGGNIKVESELAKGTTFTVALPLG
ncbi:MAG: sensor histidine kinase, partial [Spirulinaceae cyanobacterium]